MHAIPNKLKMVGVSLPLVMIFLSILVVMVASTLQGAIGEIQMASNDRFREDAFQLAQGIINEVGADINRFSLTAPLGIVSCNYVVNGSNCTPSPLVLAESDWQSKAVGMELFYEVERLSPLLQRGSVFRNHQNTTSSSLAYDVAIYETRVSADGRNANLGAASLAQGVAVLTASSSGHRAE